MQEALLAAALHWPRDGVPESPRALAAADGRAPADRPVAERAVAPASGRRSVAQEPRPAAVSDRDDTLTVLFMCCHPALTPASAIALTLRAVGGLTTAEIARAFLVDEPTMAQRITRAKQRIEESGVPFRAARRATSRPAAAAAPCSTSST